jgi:hypothetical protein
MKRLSLTFGLSPRMVRRYASIAKFSMAVVLALLGLAIVVGSSGLDRDGTIGTLIFPTLGILTLLGGVGAFLAGVVAMHREHDRSVGTILITIAGGLIGVFMIFEMFLER